jgi:hypothetical protein
MNAPQCYIYTYTAHPVIFILQTYHCTSVTLTAITVFVEFLPEDGKKLETCRMITTRLYIIVSNYSAVGMCVCVCVSTKFVGLKTCFLCCHPLQSSPCTKLLNFHSSKHPFLRNMRKTSHYNPAQTLQKSINISGIFSVQFKIK